MTDKLTDKEIVKALECCINNLCPNCPLGHHITGTYNEHCGDDLMKYALDLINHLQAENKRLKAPTTDWLVRGISPEQLEQEKIQVWKAAAYKEFAERLKKEKHICLPPFGYPIDENDWVIYEYDIDDLLKELVGEDNA